MEGHEYSHLCWEHWDNKWVLETVFSGAEHKKQELSFSLALFDIHKELQIWTTWQLKSLWTVYDKFLPDFSTMLSVPKEYQSFEQNKMLWLREERLQFPTLTHLVPRIFCFLFLHILGATETEASWTEGEKKVNERQYYWDRYVMGMEHWGFLYSNPFPFSLS